MPQPPQGVPKVVTVTLNPAVDLTVCLDLLRPGSVHRAEGLFTQAGGKGLNVATMLALAGVPSIATGLLGADNAALFEEHCARHGISEAFVRVPGVTRTNLKLVESADRRTTDLNTPGFVTPPTAFSALLERLRSVVDTGDWVLIASSLPPGVGTAELLQLLALIRVRGARIAIDTSGDPLEAAVAFGIDLAKPNRDELAALVGRPLDTREAVIEAAKAVRARGVHRLVVSLGHEGALFLGPDTACRAEALPVDVASTVGAGDAMVAGILMGLIADAPTPRLARLGTAFSASRLRSLVPSMPAPADLEALAANVQVHDDLGSR